MFTLVRDKRTGTAILGRLFMGDTCICYTLENAEKAIPCGLYTVQNSQSPKFKRELPLLHNAQVPANRGIRIHVGNTVASSSGCVLVGMGRNGDRLTESTPAETMVTMICRNVGKLVICEGWA